MCEKVKSIVLVGQTPPPHHGQAVATRILMEHQWEGIDCKKIPIRYSADLQSVGKFKFSKFRELGRVIKATLRAAHQMEDPVLYYLPASPAWVPIFRDMLYLMAVRWAFSGTVYHYHAAGLPEFLDSKGLLGSIIKKGYGKPLVAVEIADSGKSEAEFFEASRRLVVKNGLDIEGEPRCKPFEPKGGDEFAGLFLGTLCREKGVFDVLETLFLLVSRGLVVRVNFAGKWASVEEEKQFKKRVSELGIEKHVSLLGGRYGEEKWEEIRKADFFFFPSQFRFENFPLVLLEALGMGIPVVSTNWRGIPEIIQHEKTGLLCEIGDHKAFADAIERLSSEAELWQSIHQQQLLSYQKYYTEEKFCKSMKGAFDIAFEELSYQK